MSNAQRKRGESKRRAVRKKPGSKGETHPTTFRTADTVHVNKLPSDITKAELTELLKGFGEVSDLFIQKLTPHQQRSRRSYRFAFVNFKNPSDANWCLESTVKIQIRGNVLTFNKRKVSGRGKFAEIPLESLSEMVTDLSILDSALDTADNGGADKETVGKQASSEQELTEAITVQDSYGDLTTHKVPDSPQASSFLANSSVESSLPLYIAAGDVYFPPQDASTSLIVNSGTTLLVDSIPAQWTAQNFYGYASGEIAGVVSVLIYKDKDERGVHQGLIQLESESLCNSICEQGMILLHDERLDVMHSEVKSIGLLRRRYGGNFSIFEAPKPIHHEMRLSREHGLLDYADNGGEDEFWDGEMSHSRTYRDERELSAFESESPMMAPDFTPATDFTPSTDIYCDEKEHIHDTHTVPYPLCAANTTDFTTFVAQPSYIIPRSQAPAPNQKNTRNKLNTKEHMGTQGYLQMGLSTVVPTFMPMGCMVPMVASSTLIVDNIEAKVKENIQSDLERLERQYNGASSVNIAKVGHTYRAFICYQSPNHACASMPRIQKHYQGSNVHIRFA